MDEEQTHLSADDEDETVVPQEGRTRPPQVTFSKGTPDEIKSEHHYQLGETVAKGGMGEVLRAEDSSLQRTVAMKVMLPTVDGSGSAQERFLREATVLARLEHPNIIPVHELGRDEQGRPFYTMKLVKGRTLQAILDEIAADQAETIENFPLSRLLTVFRQVCDAIAFAHHRGVIHRDLKPENIMVGEFGETLVMDWGLAKILGEAESSSELEATAAETGSGPQGNPSASADLTMEGAVMGSPKYMAPEQAEGRIDQLDERTDVYALGGVLYAILTLRAPVSGGSVAEVLSNVKTGNITPPTQFNQSGANPAGEVAPAPRPEVGALPHCLGNRIPEALSAVSMTAMNLQREKRYRSVTALARDIENYQGGFATSVEDLSAWGSSCCWFAATRLCPFQSPSRC